MPPRRHGLILAVLVFAADQASKHALFNAAGLGGGAPLALGPWLDLVLVWNPGISYSLFSAQSMGGRLALLGFTLAVAAGLIVWLWRWPHSRAAAAALGCLIGGALGNAFDRAVYGKVADFIHIHFGAFAPFGVFNFADMAIFAGVVLLLYDGLFPAAAPAQGGRGSAASKLP